MDTSGLQSGISVHITQNFPRIDVDAERMTRLAQHICRRFGFRKANINVVITDDAQIRRLNKQFLGRNERTDCLSFDLSEPQSDRREFELVINGPLATEQAQLRGHSPLAELALYLAHGLLHQSGFDDTDDEQARQMHRMEDEILQQFGFGRVFSGQSGRCSEK